MDLEQLKQSLISCTTAHTSKSHKPQILTANQRQARFVKNFLPINGTQIALPVATVDQWLLETWQNLQATATPGSAYFVLSDLQENYLWQQLVQKLDNVPPLVDQESLPPLFKEAYGHMLDYGIPADELNHYHDDETRCLMALLHILEHELAHMGALLRKQLPTKITTIWQQYPDTNPYRHRCAYTYGFAEITPQMHALLHHSFQQVIELDQASLLADTATDARTQNADGEAAHHTIINHAPAITIAPPDRENKYHRSHGFATQPQEYQAACAWAKTTVQNQPEANIAIVVPNLTANKYRLQKQLLRSFDEHFFCDNTQFLSNRFFDISAGDPLLDTPPVHSALNLLQFTQFELETVKIRESCISEYWGTGVDNARCHLLEWLRRSPQKTITTSMLSKQYLAIEHTLQQHRHQDADASPSHQPTDLFATTTAEAAPASTTVTDHKDENPHDNKDNAQTQLSAAQALIAFRQRFIQQKIATRKQSFSDWIDWLVPALDHLGWPGSRELDTYEYQAVQRFLELLQQLRSLDSVAGTFNKSIRWHDFQQQLRKACQGQSFQVQTQQAQLQVLGLMEASGLPFDACWVVDMNNNNLPSPPVPNPFLPMSLQQKYETARSTPEREWRYAQRLITDIQKHCQQCIFSYAEDVEGEHHMPSPLLPQPMTHMVPDTDTRHRQDRLAAYDHYRRSNSQHTTITLGTAPAIAVGETISGGSYHLSLFAKNPLLAFFHYRLSTQAPQRPSLSYSGLDKGLLLHTCLQEFFHVYSSQQQLAAAADNWPQLVTEIESIVRREIERYPSHAKRYPLLTDTLLEVLTQRIVQFIRYELTRSDFRIEALEQSATLELAGRRIKLRLDRLDILASGESVVIDYKSGKTSLAGLQYSPIYECQLPLYLLCQPETIQGLIFAELSRDTVGYQGIVTENLPWSRRDTNDNAVTTIDKNIKTCDTLNRYQLPNSWQESVDWWRTQLHDLATQLCCGEVVFDNRHPNQTQYFDHLAGLIRDEERAFTQTR